jgi:hypothetical protein
VRLVQPNAPSTEVGSWLLSLWILRLGLREPRRTTSI